MKDLLGLTPLQLRERGILFEGSLYSQARKHLSEIAEYSDNDEVFLISNIEWAITKENNWLWEDKFKSMPIREIIKVVADDHTNDTNNLQDSKI
jgi:hypothetical protein